MSDHFLTRDIPGTGGSIKESPEDFQVEELPLYQPADEGEHLYIKIEKRNLTTHQLLRRASDIFSVSERDIGYAGLKDARATSIQTISVPLIEPARAVELENDQIRVISALRHRNKLRLGHLAGNRFRIRITGPQPESLPKAEQVLDILRQKGVPNYFGSQRYGALGNSNLVGRAILQGDFEDGCRMMMGDPARVEHPDWKKAIELFAENNLEAAIDLLPRHCRYERQLLAGLIKGKSPRKALLSLPRNILRFYLSAFQSSLFDRVVDMRLATIDIIWPGDIAFKHLNGACFRVEDQLAEQARAEQFEISATGPLFGHKVMLANGQCGILEEALLDKEKLKLPDFKLGKGLAMSGERRPIRVPVTDVGVETDHNDLIISFALPKGSYATSLLREVIKDI